MCEHIPSLDLNAKLKQIILISPFLFLFFAKHIALLVFRLVEDVSEPALAAVLAVEMRSHEDAGTALLGGALPPQPVDLAVVVHLVVLEHRQLHLLVLVLDLLGSGVVLLLPLLTSSPQPQHEVEGGLLLDVVVGQSAPVLQLLTGKDETLLVWRNSLLVLDLSLHILDAVRRLHLEGDCLAREGLDKNLHLLASFKVLYSSSVAWSF